MALEIISTIFGLRMIQLFLLSANVGFILLKHKKINISFLPRCLLLSFEYIYLSVRREAGMRLEAAESRASGVTARMASTVSASDMERPR